MSTVTKTVTDNVGPGSSSSTYKKTWTLTFSIDNLTVTGSSIKLPLPTLQMKFVGNSGLYRSTYVEWVLTLATYNMGSVRWINPTGGGFKKGTSGSVFNGVVARDARESIPTEAIFNSSNKTAKTVSIGAYAIDLRLTTQTSTGEHMSQCSRILSNVTLGTATLVAPPKITTGTPTSGTIYRTITPYSVPLTSLVGQYGGDIKTVKLTVGSQSVSQTYSANTVSNKTISLTPANTGTFTPSLTVTDSRGQSTIKNLPSITVSNYGAPSISSTAQRADTDGKLADEGTYGLLTANISYYSGAVSGLAQPTVSVTDADGNAVTTTVTWYSSWSSSSGVSNAIDWSSYHPSSPVTIYGKVLTSGGFATNTSYIMEMNVADSRGSTSGTLTQVLPSAFYTMDIQAGGKEIVFGGPANDDVSSYANGLFKCNMDIMLRDKSDVFRMLVDFMHPVGSYYETSLPSAIPSGSSTPTAADLATLGSTWFHPQYAWGGEWSLESGGKFHLSAGGSYTAGDTGGSANAIVPYHRHGKGELEGSTPTLSASNSTFVTSASEVSSARGNITSSSSSSYYYARSAASGVNWGRATPTIPSGKTVTISGYTAYVGTSGNTTGANMPPYIVVNRWHRTA